MLAFLLVLGTVALLYATRTNQQIGKRDSLDVDLASYGVRIPLVYGRDEVTGQTIWLKNNQLTEVKKKKKILFGLAGSITYYHYYATFAVALCEGTAQAVRIWADDILIVDNSARPLEDLAGDDTAAFTSQAGAAAGIAVEFHNGSDTQGPSPVILGVEGDAGTEAYRGTCYIVFDALYLTEKYGNRIPTIKAEVISGPDETAYVKDINGTCVARISDNADRFGMDYGRGMVWADSDNDTIVGYNLNSGTITETFTRDQLLGSAPYSYVQGAHAQVSPSGDVYISGHFATANSASITWAINPDTATITAATPVLGGTAGAIAISSDGDVVAVDFALNKIDFNGTRVSYSTLGWITTADPDDGQVLWAPNGAVYAFHYGSTGSGNNAYLQTYTPSSGTSLFSPIDMTAAAGVTDPNCIKWCDADSTLLLFHSGGVIKVDPADGSILATLSESMQGSIMPLLQQSQVDEDGYYWVPSDAGAGNCLARLDPINLRIVERTGNLLTTLGFVPDDCAYHSQSRSIVVAGGTVSLAQYLLRPSGSITVGSIISDLADRVGLDAGDLDVSGATQAITGFTLVEQTPLAAIVDMTGVYPHDVIDEDFQVKVFPRGGQTPIVIEAADMGAAVDRDAGEPVYVRKLGSDREPPQALHLTYANADADFEEFTASWSVPLSDTTSRKIEKHRTNVVMDHDESHTQAFVMFAAAHREREELEIKLPAKYAHVNAGDVLSVPVDGNETLTVRVTEVSVSEVGEYLGVIEEATSYSQTLTSPLPTPTPGTITPTAERAQALIIDAALPYDSAELQTGYGFAALPRPTGLALPDTDVFVSIDDGTNYDRVGGYEGTDPLIIGTATTALSGHRCDRFDRINTLTVRMASGSLSSQTESALLGDQSLNCAYVQAGTDWEVIQFADVTDNGDGTYTLANLIRGARGTEHLVSSHAVGDAFVLATSVDRATKHATLNAALDALAVPTGGDVANAPVAELVMYLRGLKPYSVTEIAGSRIGGNLTITWRRRTRLGGASLDGQDVPLSEDSEAYEVDIMSGSTVLRTISASSETASYSSSEQNADGLTPGDPVEVNIYQISATVGRGTVANATV